MIGTTLGPYRVLEKLGEGGMGEVYRARDTRLDRTVAIKVLPAGVAGDPDLRARFEREARAVAALNHPHICTLHDVGEHDGTTFLVMEYLEGETLADRLHKGALPLDQVLRYAIEIADALDKAHRAGIVHRDLKPGNVMLTKSGAKLLDFGLAKAAAPAVAGVASMAPTAMPFDGAQGRPITAQGTILGTLQYMAPEQVEGKDADARTDIFAFGEIVYEMATGTKAFQGKSQASLIGAILKDDPPPIAASQPLTPPTLDRVVKKCLAKDPDNRWQSASDLTDELKWIADAGSQAGVAMSGSAAARGLSNNARLAWLVAFASLAIAAVALGGMRYLSRASIADTPLWVSLSAPERDFGRSPAPAVSPDGRTIAFAAPDKSGQVVLWIRALESPAARALPGTEGAGEPFWAPEGRSLGFFAGGKLKRIDVTGESAPQVLADAPTQRGGTWSRDGVIVFVPAGGGPLHRVSVGGGTPVPLAFDVTEVLSPESPSFLPDGRHFLFTTYPGPKSSGGVWAASIDSRSLVRVGDMRSRVTYSAGYLLFGRGRELYAQPFDPARLQLSGEPIRLAENLGKSSGSAVTYAFSTSGSDVLAYGTGVSPETTQPRWLDRRGMSLGTVGEPGMYYSLVLSPDERQVAVERFDPATNRSDVWTIDVGTGVASRLTADPDGWSYCPLWAAGGESILFLRSVAGTLRVTSLDGKKTDDIPVGGTGSVFPTAWSSDGRFVVFVKSDPKTLADLWLVPLEGDRKPRPYLQTSFSETTGRVSPDSQWLAYVSNETGRQEVYVQSFPVPGSKRRVSVTGGRQPQWNRRGTELYYLSLDQKLMAATVSRAGSSLELSPPSALFDAPRVPTDFSRFPYAVTADGQRFLFNAVTTDVFERGIVVGIHWPAALRK